MKIMGVVMLLNIGELYIPLMVLFLVLFFLQTVIINGKDKILDFTYITDVVNGITTLIEKNPKEIEFNIASGKGENLVEVAKMLKEMLNSKSKIKIKESLIGEVINFSANIERMKSLGWEPKVSLVDGLNRSIEYYKVN